MVLVHPTQDLHVSGIDAMFTAGDGNLNNVCRADACAAHLEPAWF